MLNWSTARLNYFYDMNWLKSVNDLVKVWYIFHISTWAYKTLDVCISPFKVLWEQEAKNIDKKEEKSWEIAVVKRGELKNSEYFMRHPLPFFHNQKCLCLLWMPKIGLIALYYFQISLLLCPQKLSRLSHRHWTRLRSRISYQYSV